MVLTTRNPLASQTTCSSRCCFAGEDGVSAEGDYEYAGYTTRIYDNEVRFFFDQLDRGKHEVSFLFRTTTPGTYPTPPVQAELMYQPEVFGRTSGSVFQIGGSR